MKKIHLSVTNDLYTDQRVLKMARTLHDMGFDVHLCGVKRRDSKPFSLDFAHITRIPLLFHKRFLFYAEYNLKLFFHLLFRRYDVLVSNDLDTLLPNHLVARIKRKPLVYDAHEYFTGTPEVISRPFVFKVWKKLEKWLFPRQHKIITVNDSIARLYADEYGKTLHVVRNLPRYRQPEAALPAGELSIPPLRDIILLQGTGINIDRGAEELVMAMRPEHGLKDVLLLIIGSGDVIPKLQEMMTHYQLDDRVWFLGKMAPEDLREYTRHAKIGVSLDKDTNINYRYSLPNKIFDYMMAGVPQLVSRLPELERIVSTYQTGMIADSHEPQHIADCIREMLSDKARLKEWKQNSLEAAKTLCWENEDKTIREIYLEFVSDSTA